MICLFQRREAMIVWQHYESLTTTLAQELCEQLRIVLAPTLAAKFKYVLQMLLMNRVRLTL